MHFKQNTVDNWVILHGFALTNVTFLCVCVQPGQDSWLKVNVSPLYGEQLLRYRHRSRL